MFTRKKCFREVKVDFKWLIVKISKLLIGCITIVVKNDSFLFSWSIRTFIRFFWKILRTISIKSSKWKNLQFLQLFCKESFILGININNIIGFIAITCITCAVIAIMINKINQIKLYPDIFMCMVKKIEILCFNFNLILSLYFIV